MLLDLKPKTEAKITLPDLKRVVFSLINQIAVTAKHIQSEKELQPALKAMPGYPKCQLTVERNQTGYQIGVVNKDDSHLIQGAFIADSDLKVDSDAFAKGVESILDAADHQGCAN